MTWLGHVRSTSSWERERQSPSRLEEAAQAACKIPPKLSWAAVLLVCSLPKGLSRRWVRRQKFDLHTGGLEA